MLFIRHYQKILSVLTICCLSEIQIYLGILCVCAKSGNPVPGPKARPLTAPMEGVAVSPNEDYIYPGGWLYFLDALARGPEVHWVTPPRQ